MERTTQNPSRNVNTTRPGGNNNNEEDSHDEKEVDTGFAADKSAPKMSPYPPLAEVSKQSSGRSKVGPGNVGHSSNKPLEKSQSRLVTTTFRYDRVKPDNLFPATKKYRYHPVTCEYCGKRGQPTKLKAHLRKHHFAGIESAPAGRQPKIEKPPAPKKSAGVPRFETCYICGGMFGSRSINIHEPKCLDKWRIENERLPKRLRMPEPVKPKPLPVDTKKQGYDVPEFDRKAEAAFRSHLSTLIPCSHCSRTFSPDRIQRHMSCCIEKPKSRKRTAPEDEKNRR